MKDTFEIVCEQSRKVTTKSWRIVQISGLTAVLLAAGCSKISNSEPNTVAETPAPAAPDAVPPPAVKPGPASTAPVGATGQQAVPAATPEPLQKHLAPAGVFYVTRHISITTDDGITAVAPGTKVTLVKDLGAKLRVSNGKMEFEAEADQLTNDLDVLNMATRAASNQAGAIAAWKQAQSQGATSIDQQQQVQAQTTQAADTQTKSAQQIQTRIDVLTREKARLTGLIERANIEESNERFDRIGRRLITTKSALAKERPNMQAQLAGVERELIQISSGS